ncbi:MAG TPA: tryptophan--tRNA ligase [Candidatus Dormibacteraeota bacterium]|jgi:tryptophanyl-tRNA synthetase|nr:tryptophan--tRNA ligase [Candidatus Dormibacteraeota bacterium]
MSDSARRPRVLSGMQPTGRMHIGHYFGALRNFVRMQDEFEAFYCVVDLHALTTFENPAELWPNVMAMVADWLAAGIDPEKATIFVQSRVPEVTELHWLLSCTTPISWLERVPTFKEKSEQHPDNVNYALLGYPVLQAADILLYGADKVPVGEDQLAHLELTREIVRRFHHRFGPIFREPAAVLTDTPRIMGLDGVNKMSKSRDNYIPMTGDPDQIRALIGQAFTDQTRVYRRDPGHPELCNVCQLHRLFSADYEAIWEGERSAATGCVDTKKLLAERVIAHFEPMRRRRQEIDARPGYVEGVLERGAERAREVARDTLAQVKAAVGLR